MDINIRPLLHPESPTMVGEIETLEPTFGDRYILGVRGFCGHLHHMVIPTRDLAPLIQWPTMASYRLEGDGRGADGALLPTVGDVA